ncbi:PTS sugar transporter subunit IIB [Companilactobacillus hulinensis]|uniref:PTS sugar transporter subunit IIB n=1 Tax=Companilactobacillus hulinensis TaxID=2486007 RepID=UPI000F777221|nr:PTS sugar transporter subunit IIB [Companilactobacillus hulinensis]
MNKKVIMLCCAGGMSTSLLVTKMQKAATKDGIEVEIFATGAASAEYDVSQRHPDVIMVGPQIRFLEKEFKEKFSMPVEVIGMHDYGTMNGEKVLKRSLELISDEATK